jgi:hypothetical protein
MSRAARPEIRKKIKKIIHEKDRTAAENLFNFFSNIDESQKIVFRSLYVPTGNNFSRNFPSKQIAEMIMALTDTKWRGVKFIKHEVHRV